MEPQTLTAEVRTTSGKGSSRQLRKQGKIPAIFYGPGLDPVKLTVAPDELERILNLEHRRNQLIDLSWGEGSGLALVRDLEVDPVTRTLMHADFYAVSRERKVKTTVPFTTKGRSIGVQKGGKIRKLFRELPVEANPQDVPASIVLDVGPLDVNTVVRVSDLKLPEGVAVTFPPARRVLLVELKEVKEEEEEGAEKAAKPA